MKRRSFIKALGLGSVIGIPHAAQSSDVMAPERPTGPWITTLTESLLPQEKYQAALNKIDI